MDTRDSAPSGVTGNSISTLEPSPRTHTGPTGSRMGLVAVGTILILATIVMPFVANASTSRLGGTVDVARTERIVGDLNVAGGTITMDGVVTGDANIAGVQVPIPGTIDGTLNTAGGKVELSGITGGSARVAGGEVTITGNITGDLLVIGGRVSIPSQARIAGDVIVTGGQVDIRGTVDGSLKVQGSDVTLGGVVIGNADISGSSIELLGPARIGGKLTYTSSSTADVATNAVVTGETTQNKPASIGNSSRSFFNPWLRVIWALLAGIVVVALAPRVMGAVGKSGRRILPAIGIGIVSLILVPIVAIALMITVIGLPIGAIILAAYFIVLYLSQVVVGTMLGRFILSGRWDDGSRGFILLCMTLGVIIISGLRFIPLPYISGGVSLIVSIWGVGTVIMLFGRLRPSAGRHLAAV
ncbi:MAG: hypothetical protein ACR2OU_21420 [Thermomicrobiales bacterium]